ncbi:MAG TPA: hypothetical protein VHB69_03830 [Mycobacteriales bacterium]|nr:hypothetical protein [Mycobacteriales bacterium]
MSGPSQVMRCAVHVGRAAHDHCPVCGRPRCDDDAADYRDRGCAACVVNRVAARPVPRAARLVAAGVPVVPIAAVGGWIYSQYVEVHIFSWLVPALLGVAGSSVAGALLHRVAAIRQRIDRLPLLAGAIAAVLGTALGFRLFPHGPHDPLHPWHEVGLPYICAVVAAIVWPLILGPPRRTQPAELTG